MMSQQVVDVGHMRAVPSACMEWPIQHFSINMDLDKPLRSPWFSTYPEIHCCWRMAVIQLTSAKPYFSVYVWYSSPGKEDDKVVMLLELGIINKGLETCNVQKKKVNPSTGGILFTNFQILEHLLLKSDEWMPNNTLTLQLKVMWHHPSTIAPSFMKLGNDMLQLYTSRNLTDVTLVSKDNKEICAHKAVLGARSGVFAAMFSNDMMEKKTGKVEIRDFDADVLEEMLYYMYTDEQPKNLFTLGAEILVAADKYDVAGLKRMCENSLMQSLSLEKIVPTINIAMQGNSEKLKQYCVQNAVKSLPAWKTSAYWKDASTLPPDILVEILGATVK